MNGWGHMGAWGGGWMWLIWLAVLVVLVVFVYQLVARGRSQPPGGRVDPLETLKQRYARGEITRQEYEQMRRDLES